MRKCGAQPRKLVLMTSKTRPCSLIKARSFDDSTLGLLGSACLIHLVTVETLTLYSLASELAKRLV